MGSDSKFLRLFIIGSMLVLSAASFCITRTSFHSDQLMLRAAPKRLEGNTDGILYVNDRCINCAACSNFSPTVFERSASELKHVVCKQPTLQNLHELEEARAALAACPVAAIRVENTNLEENELLLKRALSIKQSKDEKELFPRPIANDLDLGVHYLGHHNDASFGAIPYLVRGKSFEGDVVFVMVDVPKFSAKSVKAVKSLSPNGPEYLFLTHVDDTADHNKWAKEFPNMKRIFHAGDLGRNNWIGDSTLEDVEILLKENTEVGAKEKMMIWDIEGNLVDDIEGMNEEAFVILHTPGHSPGSISLLFRPKLDSSHRCNGILFTGDTYSWTTRDGGKMTGFPRYGNNLSQQAQTLRQIGKTSNLWDIVAPGHGHLRSYLKLKEGENTAKIKGEDVDTAISELLSY